jgi:hydrogenase-4 component F
MVKGQILMLIYCIIGIIALIIILVLRSHNGMVVVSVIHALLSLAVTFYILFFTSLPVYYLDNRFFFIDHLGLYETIITWLIFILSAFFSMGYMKHLLEKGKFKKENLKLFYFAFNLLPINIMFAFFSNNLAMFWVLTELTTLVSAILIVLPNAKENISIALNYIFIASTSMLFSFIGIILLFGLTKHAAGTGTLNWDTLLSITPTLSSPVLALSIIFLFVGFATKSGIAPFHTWLPHAHATAPSIVSTLLSAVLLNVGMYGIIRIYALTVHTPAKWIISVIFFIFGFFTILIAALTMFSQKSLKKFIAYSSIENMGLILIGIGIGTPLAIFWVLFHKLAHSLSKALLFFSAGVIQYQYDDKKIDEMSDVLRLQPFSSFCLIIGSLTVIGIPLFPVFFSKLGIVLELTNVSKILLLVLVILFCIVASAFSVVLIGIFSKKSPAGKKLSDRHIVPFSIVFPIVILVGLIFILGVFIPQSLNNLLLTIVSQLGI